MTEPASANTDPASMQFSGGWLDDVVENGSIELPVSTKRGPLPS
jgi:hypothetical protein